MLLPTMNYEEMYREVILDSENMIRWVGHNIQNLRRISLKAKQFPFANTLTHMTPRHNTWHYIVVVRRKIRSIQDVYNVIYTSLRAPEGEIYILMQPNKHKQMNVCAYTPHFMQRFAERMEIDLTGKELANRYFIYNDNGRFVKQPVGEHQECLCTNEGICLGEFVNDRMFVARTFIRYDMSLGWQRDAFKACKDMTDARVMTTNFGYLERSKIKDVYRERDRSQPIIFHH